jgi:hypothetical protein
MDKKNKEIRIELDEPISVPEYGEGIADTNISREAYEQMKYFNPSRIRSQDEEEE